MPAPITVRDLGKRYNRYRTTRAYTFHEAVLSGWRCMPKQETFWALNGICFDVMPGEMLGIIGRNGGGKSTLLKLLGGIIQPDCGSVRVDGHFGALLEPRGTLHPELTGRENVRTCGVIAGLTRAQVKDKFDSIVSFAEVESVIDNPIRTYSTGMKLRLAFAIAVHTNASILLIDEFLSVGDEEFQTKCLKRIAELRKQGCAIVFVSHDLDEIGLYCEKAIYLTAGCVTAYDDAKTVVQQYLQDIAAKSSFEQANYLSSIQA